MIRPVVLLSLLALGGLCVPAPSPVPHAMLQAQPAAAAPKAPESPTPLGELKVIGPASVARDTFAEFRLDLPKDAKVRVTWDVYPEAGVRIKEGRGWCIVAGKPGAYSLRATAYAVVGGEVDVARARHSFVVTKGDCPCPPQPAPPAPTPPAPQPPAPQPPATPPGNTLSAIGQVRFGNSSCTATVIGGLKDRRKLALTAAHCVSGIGQAGTIKLKDGRSFAVKVLTLNRTSDVCWLEVQSGAAELPTAWLADGEPAVGTRVWHSGYGVDKPGNREDGTVTAAPNRQGQLAYRLSVSPGDSGGGIVVDATGRVLSPVCCTTCLGCVGTVYGGSVAAVRAALPLPAVAPSPAAAEAPDTPPGLARPILHHVPAPAAASGRGEKLFYPLKEIQP